jgi:hypothetical protein
MIWFEIFILAIFLVILGMAFKCEFYSGSQDEKFTNENRQSNINYKKIYPYGSVNYFRTWGWYPYRGLWPYYNPWWYYPYSYLNPYPNPFPIVYNNFPSNVIKRNEI